MEMKLYFILHQAHLIIFILCVGIGGVKCNTYNFIVVLVDVFTSFYMLV